MNYATSRELVTLSVAEGSYVIERYEHDHGVQWLVQRVKDGTLELLVVFPTRRQAARFVESIRG